MPVLTADPLFLAFHKWKYFSATYAFVCAFVFAFVCTCARFPVHVGAFLCQTGSPGQITLRCLFVCVTALFVAQFCHPTQQQAVGTLTPSLISWTMRVILISLRPKTSASQIMPASVYLHPLYLQRQYPGECGYQLSALGGGGHWRCVGQTPVPPCSTLSVFVGIEQCCFPSTVAGPHESLKFPFLGPTSAVYSALLLLWAFGHSVLDFLAWHFHFQHPICIAPLPLGAYCRVQRAMCTGRGVGEFGIGGIWHNKIARTEFRHSSQENSPPHVDQHQIMFKL